MKFCIKSFLILVPLLFARPLSAQDNVILPDIQLSIGDQSTVSTETASEALLKDRSPIFEQVYLEELNPSRGILIQDTNIRYSYAASRVKDLTAFQFLYGYYHQTDASARLRRKRGPLTWDLLYRGFSRQYALDSRGYFPQSSFYTNSLGIIADAALPQTRLHAFFGYKQDKIGFLSPITRLAHHVPLGINLKHWIGASSFIAADVEGEFFIQDHQNQNAALLRTQSMGGARLSMAYDAGLAPWNRLRVQISSTLSGYGSGSANHATILSVLAEFNIGKGVFLTAGFSLAPRPDFYGWPEFALRYQYGEIFRLNLSVSGDFRIYTAREAFTNLQVFAANAPADARMVFRVSADGSLPLFRYGAYLQANLWKGQRAYLYNGEYYTFYDAGASSTLGAGLNFGASYAGIVDFTLRYDYESVPSGRLLRPEHTAGIVLGLGYIPAGFRWEGRFSFGSPKNMGDGSNRFLTRLDFMFSQRIYREASFILEFLNILNTDLYDWADLPGGGFQMRGGIQLSF